MRRIAIIPARAGSVRIPGKNERIFHGHPIIKYSIDVAQRSGLFEQVWVSTDSARIGAYAQALGAHWLLRAGELAGPKAGTQAVVQHAVRQLSIEPGAKVCCIYATAPMLQIRDLDRGHNALTSQDAFTIAVGTEPLRDAGMFYWGWAESFEQGIPLYTITSRVVPIPEDQVCDINTEADWQKALAMFAALKGGQSHLPDNSK